MFDHIGSNNQFSDGMFDHIRSNNQFSKEDQIDIYMHVFLIVDSLSIGHAIHLK